MHDQRFAGGTESPQLVQNNRTLMNLAGGVFTREPMRGPAALSRYENALRQAVLHNSGNRVFVAVLDSDGSSSHHTIMSPGESLVFGRHHQAGLWHDSEDVSLRHLALAVAPSSTASAPLVRVWDLATNRPFKTEDGQYTAALTADGPVFITLGSISLAMIPLGSVPRVLPMGTQALWEALPKSAITSHLAEGSDIGRTPHDPSARQTMVTRIPSARAPEDCLPELAVAQLALSTSQGCRRFQLSEEALVRGVLIGRYNRCISMPGNLDMLSRVHLLISRIGTRIVAIDTASTCGSTHGCAGEFEATVVAEHDEFLLAGSLLVEWDWSGLSLDIGL